MEGDSLPSLPELLCELPELFPFVWVLAQLGYEVTPEGREGFLVFIGDVFPLVRLQHGEGCCYEMIRDTLLCFTLAQPMPASGGI